MIDLNEPPETPDWHTDARCSCCLGDCTVCVPAPTVPANVVLATE